MWRSGACSRSPRSPTTAGRRSTAPSTTRTWMSGSTSWRSPRSRRCSCRCAPAAALSPPRRPPRRASYHLPSHLPSHLCLARPATLGPAPHVPFPRRRLPAHLLGTEERGARAAGDEESMEAADRPPSPSRLEEGDFLLCFTTSGPSDLQLETARDRSRQQHACPIPTPTPTPTANPDPNPNPHPKPNPNPNPNPNPKPQP